MPGERVFAASPDAVPADEVLALTPPALSPLVVRQLCIQLDGVAYKDAHALAVARLLVQLPVPLGWKHAVAAGNRSCYIDKR